MTASSHDSVFLAQSTSWRVRALIGGSVWIAAFLVTRREYGSGSVVRHAILRSHIMARYSSDASPAWDDQCARVFFRRSVSVEDRNQRATRRQGLRLTSLRTPKLVSLLGLQESKRTHILLGRRFPVAQEYRVDHESGFSLAPQQVAQRLHHQILSRQAEKDAERVDSFADEGNAVGRRNGPRD